VLLTLPLQVAHQIPKVLLLQAQPARFRRSYAHWQQLWLLLLLLLVAHQPHHDEAALPLLLLLLLWLEWQSPAAAQVAVLATDLVEWCWVS
jgi:hypothetical protein